MKIPTTTLTAGLLLMLPLTAQEAEPDALDPIDAAIAAFNNRDLDTAGDSKPDEEPKPDEPEGKPVLVTGKKPKDPNLIDISEVPVDPDAAQELPPAEPEAKGLRVRVEQLAPGKGKLKPESVRLLAPFPAKALDEAPPGWLLQTSDTAPAFKRQVELTPGKAITLTIKPHVLVPDADHSRILAVPEPGFEASLGYGQSDTVAAVLSDSIRKLNEDSQRIGDAIDQLQQLIVSLPKPEIEKPDSASSIPDAGTPIPEQP